MPSFPASVFAPTTKTAAQTIQAAHVNDVQDEIVAIEGGYRNATAPLNSSNSTLAALSVVGNSTLASSITLGTIPYIMPSSGGSTGHVLMCVSTSGSTMGLEWRSQAASVPDAARVEMDALQELTQGGTTPISWTGQIFATNSSIHSTGTNPSRLTPQSTGIYLFHCGAIFDGAGSQCLLSIQDSSNGVVARAASSGGDDAIITASGIKRFDVTGGYATVVPTSANSTNRVLAQSVTFFSMVKL